MTVTELRRTEEFKKQTSVVLLCVHVVSRESAK